MNRIWLIVSILCGVTAVAFFTFGKQDTAFVLAAVGAVAWFLNYRTQLKHGMKDDEEET